ncbi:hypothetical protein UVI_02016490 [Ustilaginoidea virens]|uniref:Uncharacterized protein n=1 Tax=Ustilaginoidea virens TaxID=1159556 RepID=A0A1B5KU14_USTVR|nr:hypothetical protein UVI_02016490 [Ustilaginoidea virens]
MPRQESREDSQGGQRNRGRGYTARRTLRGSRLARRQPETQQADAEGNRVEQTADDGRANSPMPGAPGPATPTRQCIEELVVPADESPQAVGARVLQAMEQMGVDPGIITITSVETFALQWVTRRHDSPRRRLSPLDPRVLPGPGPTPNSGDSGRAEDISDRSPRTPEEIERLRAVISPPVPEPVAGTEPSEPASAPEPEPVAGTEIPSEPAPTLGPAAAPAAVPTPNTGEHFITPVGTTPVGTTPIDMRVAYSADESPQVVGARMLQAIEQMGIDRAFGTISYVDRSCFQRVSRRQIGRRRRLAALDSRVFNLRPYHGDSGRVEDTEERPRLWGLIPRPIPELRHPHEETLPDLDPKPVPPEAVRPHSAGRHSASAPIMMTIDRRDEEDYLFSDDEVQGDAGAEGAGDQPPQDNDGDSRVSLNSIHGRSQS